MNKTKMTLIGIGGGAGLLVLVAAYFAWSAFSNRTIATEGDYEGETTGLDSVMEQAQQLSRKKIYPCAASLREIESNRTAVVEWTKEASALAARGDRVFPSVTPAQFKTDIVNEAQRLRALPGHVAGKLTKEDFAFGPFKDYVAGGSMPKESELPELQRKWDDVVTVVETIASCGVAEITDIQFKVEEKPAEPTDRRARALARARNAKKDAANANEPKSFSYVITFSSRPSALVKILNAFVVCERFVTVDALTFSRPKDVIAAAFGEDEKKPEAAGGRRGRRGRRGSSGGEAPSQAPDENDKSASASKNRIVTDPLQDEPMSVVLTVTVSDFNSLSEKGTSK